MAACSRWRWLGGLVAVVPAAILPVRPILPVAGGKRRRSHNRPQITLSAVLAASPAPAAHYTLTAGLLATLYTTFQGEITWNRSKIYFFLYHNRPTRLYARAAVSCPKDLGDLVGKDSYQRLHLLLLKVMVPVLVQGQSLGGLNSGS
jgi:hypothetical protein